MMAPSIREQMLRRMMKHRHDVGSKIEVMSYLGNNLVPQEAIDQHALTEAIAIGTCNRCGELYSATVLDCGGEPVLIGPLTGGKPGTKDVDIRCPKFKPEHHN